VSKLFMGFLGVFWSALSWAQSIPTVTQWVGIFQEVRQHALFENLKLSYAKTLAENAGYSPVGVMPREGQDCVIVISEGHNPKMERIMKLTSTQQNVRPFLLAMAAHELGHCFRIRSKHLSADLWERVDASVVGSAERQQLEKVVSIEEAYADAYAFTYILHAHPKTYSEVFSVMHSLRHEPGFATAFYQVEPLYVLLGSQGLDVSLPLQNQIEVLMNQVKFQGN
jgi:hypothetical protein